MNIHNSNPATESDLDELAIRKKLLNDYGIVIPIITESAPDENEPLIAPVRPEVVITETERKRREIRDEKLKQQCIDIRRQRDHRRRWGWFTYDNVEFIIAVLLVTWLVVGYFIAVPQSIFMMGPVVVFGYKFWRWFYKKIGVIPYDD